MQQLPARCRGKRQMSKRTGVNPYRRVAYAMLLAAATCALSGGKPKSLCQEMPDRNSVSPTIGQGPLADSAGTRHAENAAHDTRGATPGEAQNGVGDLKRIYGLLGLYRERHGGEFPAQASAMLTEVMSHAADYGFADPSEAVRALANPDSVYSDSSVQRHAPDRAMPYRFSNRRLDGTAVGSPKAAGTRDVLSYTPLYSHQNARLWGEDQSVRNPVGFYLVLWDDGEVAEIPYDLVMYVPKSSGEYGFAFPGQAGVGCDCMTYDEFWTRVAGESAPSRGKPLPPKEIVALPDNGGPEALVSLSRLLTAPMGRERLWELLDSAQEVFSLRDLAAAGKELGLGLREERISLDELERRSRPAILRLGNPDRLIVLATLGTNRALIYDKGWLQFVPRSMVAERYVGQTLLPTPAEAAASLRVERPLREVELKSFQDTASETFTITNVGSKPLQLWTESPACGCTSVELSPADLPPNATSVLRATIRPRGAGTPRWATQLATIAIRTNDPSAPRVMVGVELHVQVPKP